MHAALFDLDGVIIDTESIYSLFWGSIGRQYNVKYHDFADRIKGTTLEQILNGYFSKEVHAEIIDMLIDYENNMVYRLFPGVTRFLEHLRQRGIPAAIVTSSGEKKMSHLWQQHPDLKGYFQAIITDAQVTKSKPDPQGYLLAAEALSVDPSQCYVFEDSFNGLLAGRRSGAKVIGVASTNPKETLSDKADYIIDGFENFDVDKMLSI